MITRSLAHLLQRNVELHGDSIAFVDRDSSYTYTQIWDLACQFASAATASGLSKGDRIAIYFNKRIETVCAIYGAAIGRFVFVPINPVLKPAQVRHIANDCGAKLLVTNASRAQSLDLDAVDIVTIDGGNWASLDTWLQQAENSKTSLQNQETDIVGILYTSGSTGKPKGVVLSNANMVVGAASVADYLENDQHDVILSILPLSFDAGISQLTTALVVGAKVVLAEFVLPSEVVKLVRKHRVTGVTGVPPLWHQIADVNWGDAGRFLRYFANTGGHMPRSLLKKLRNVFPNASPFLMYGLTEAFRSTYLPPQYVDLKPDSIGKAIPNAELFLVNRDGNLCKPNEPGELVHAGPLVAHGYWGDSVRTAERFRPAPFSLSALPNPQLAVWSGDQMTMDEDGFLYFVGREDDMIKTSGYRVSPTEIEEATLDTGLVSEVAAFGLPDQQLGHQIVIVVTPRSGIASNSEDLMSALKLRIPQYMVPRRIVWLENLPRNPNGKLDRTGMRDKLLAEE